MRGEVISAMSRVSIAFGISDSGSFRPIAGRGSPARAIFAIKACGVVNCYRSATRGTPIAFSGGCSRMIQPKA